MYRRDITSFLTFKDAWQAALGLRYLRLNRKEADLLVAVYAAIEQGALVKSWRVHDAYGEEQAEQGLDNVFGR